MIDQEPWLRTGIWAVRSREWRMRMASVGTASVGSRSRRYTYLTTLEMDFHLFYPRHFRPWGTLHPCRDDPCRLALVCVDWYTRCLRFYVAVSLNHFHVVVFVKSHNICAVDCGADWRKFIRMSMPGHKELRYICFIQGVTSAACDHLCLIDSLVSSLTKFFFSKNILENYHLSFSIFQAK